MKRVGILIFLTILNFGFAFSQDLKINELMPSNGITRFDSYGDSPDWLEIYNNTNSPIQLSDYYISNNQSDKLKWNLPVKNLQPHKWVLIYCSGRDIRVTEYHANFKLKNTTDTVGIYFKDGSTIDEIAYDSMPSDISYGLQPDGANVAFYFSASSPKATNNNSNAFSCILDAPVVSVESGFYTSPLSLGISHPEPGVSLHYTETGDTPTELDPIYNGSFSISTNYAPNRLSTIPTNPGLNAPQGFYSVTRSNNRGYVPPAVDVQNINVFKVKAYKSGCIESDAVAKTYVLNDGSISFPDMPIISIQTDSIGLFSADTGIYVYGNKYLGNYLRRGSEWERVGHLVYFDQNKTKKIDQRLGVELHGNGSRHSTHKNLRVSAKSRYGESSIDGELFPNYEIDEFKKLIVRSPGHRPDCMPRDELATSLVAKIGFDIQNYVTSVMYLNGEYWGINVLKERFDDEYISIKYEMKDDEIVILEGKGDLDYGEPADTVDYYEMLDFVSNNNLDVPSNMEYLNTQMDIENYIDFMASEIYMGNGDWPTNNMRFWRKRIDYDDFASPGHDGRWRWMFFDLDGGFGGTCDDVYFAINNLERALVDTGVAVPYTQLFRDLVNNQSFRELYINRSCDRLNSNFKESVTVPKLNEIVTELNPIMMDHVNRFGYPSTSTTLVDRLVETPSLDKWNYLVTRFEKFVNRRNFYVRRHMQEEWGLLDTFNITIDVNDATMGYVKLNSLEINQELEGVNANPYPWVGMYFEDIRIPMQAQAYPGYRFKEWLGIPITKSDTSVIINSDTIYTAIFEIDPNYVTPIPIVINEIQAWNSSTVFDENFEYDDWIELYNPNDVDIDITGYYLTDDENDLKKYAIKDNTTIIPANDWMVFWADGETGQGQNHTNFKLNKEGDFVALIAPDGITILDSIRFGAQLEDYSYGRLADGMSPWVEFEYPTPFYSNLSTSIEDVDEEVSLKVYPNPVNGGSVYFNKNITAEIYTISGVLMESITNVNSISIESYTIGVYIIRDTLTGESIKLIVQ